MSMIDSVLSSLGAYSEPDVRAFLHADHLQIRELATELAEASTAVRRRSVLGQLKPLLLAHSRSEEAAVYKRLMKSKPAEARLAGNEGLVEHNVADILLSRLAASSDTATDMWKAHAKVLHEALEHHIKEEESDIFHDLGQLYSDEERAKMGREYVVGRDKRLSAKPASTAARKRKAA